MAKTEFVVSACLVGFRCRYDGSGRPCAAVRRLYEEGRALALCPESLSGLERPRPPCEQRFGRVICRDGRDVTGEFRLGAFLALQKALASGCRRAILKSRSPSCGRDAVYDGAFGGRLVPGAGIFAALLRKNGFELFDEENLPQGLEQGGQSRFINKFGS